MRKNEGAKAMRNFNEKIVITRQTVVNKVIYWKVLCNRRIIFIMIWHEFKNHGNMIRLADCQTEQQSTISLPTNRYKSSEYDSVT